MTDSIEETGRATRRGFTLVELLVVIAVIAILCALLSPRLAYALERANVARVQGELQQIEVALTMYHNDYKRFPPVRVSCNMDERDHWCELPSELVSLGYLPPTKKKNVSSMMEDPFNPGHTYKYATPGPYYLNGILQQEGYSVYVPDDFPICKSPRGTYHSRKSSPLGWVVWSLGPRQTLAKALNSRAPISAETWYHGGRDNGVIGRIHMRNGNTFQTQ